MSNNQIAEQSRTDTQTNAVANSLSQGGITLPAVSVLQKKEKETPFSEDVSSDSPVIEAPLQQKEDRPAVPFQFKPNNTGLPDNLKSGVENLSGIAMDDVKVHYNSGQPAQLNAYAYAQGKDIHIGPGQEKHLPHEAWHVVQQAQGRVEATRQMKSGVPVNDNPSLEQEADVMGAKAAQLPFKPAAAALATTGISPVNTIAQFTAKEATPTTPAWEENASGGAASSPEIQNKKNHLQRIYGGVPSAYPVGWTQVLSSATKVKGSWVRFHLINHNIGGPGNNGNNLVPTTNAINSGVAWSSFETDVKGHFDNNEWVWCKVTVTYDASYPAGFPKTIKGEAQWYDSNAPAGWKNIATNGTTLSISAPNFGSGIKTRTLDEMTAATWALVVQQGVGTDIVKYLNSLSSKSSDIDDFNEALYEEGAPKISDGIQKLIDAAIKGTHPLVYIAVDY